MYLDLKKNIKNKKKQLKNDQGRNFWTGNWKLSIIIMIEI